MRLIKKVENFWHAKSTPESERKNVSQKFESMLNTYISSDKTKQARILFLVEQYYLHIKKYYEIERKVIILFNEHQ